MTDDTSTHDAAFEELVSRFPDEVVTEALVRDVRLPLGAGTMALITLDNGRDHTRPTSFGPAGLMRLKSTLEAQRARARAGEIVAVGITGKPFVLAAGADLNVLESAGGREDALTLGRLGHGAIGLLGELGVPSFCFVNGVALGGGLEVALNSTYRTVSAAAAGLGLPETMLGILPGWGGAYLLPRLIGPEAAVEVIVRNPQNNRTLKGPDAFRLGIADALFDSADFLERSLSWAAEVISGARTVERRGIAGADDFEGAVARGREFLDRKLHGAAPAPYRALELIEAARTSEKADAFEAENEALADLIATPETSSSLYAYSLVQQRAKRPAGAPDKKLAASVTTVGILGAGLMASQLALLFARRLQVPVLMTDLDQGRVDKGVGYVRAEIDSLVAKGRLGAAEASRIKALVIGTVSKEPFAGADFIIEAVFEELGVKKQVLAEIEAIASETAILATNTSALSVTEMSAGLAHPERVIGFHFFNPVAVLPLLEVVRTEHTSDATLATALDVAKRLRKNAVITADAPGFVVNRVLTRFSAEINRLVDEGLPLEEADRALDDAGWGLPMRPFHLMQLVGPAVGLHVNETLHAAFGGERFPVSEGLRQLVAAGRKGVWSSDDTGRQFIDDETRGFFGVGTGGAETTDVSERIADALADEIGRMLDEGVVAAAEDIDLCLILGAGWPFHLGGITPFLDRSGASTRVRGRLFHP